MAFPTGWAGYDTHATTTEPSGALTDFTYLVDLSLMSATWWSEVKSDGGDIRASKEDNTQLPCDLIEFDYGNETGLLAVKYSGTKSAVSNEPIRIWCGKSDESFPADNDTYGADNAYASHWKAFYPSGGGDDRTVNANNLTMTGGPSVGGASGPWGSTKATDYIPTDYGEATASVPTAAPMSFLASFNADSDGRGLIGVFNPSSGTNYFALYYGAVHGGTASRIHYDVRSGTPNQATASSTDGTGSWHRAAGVSVATNSTICYANGGNSGSSGSTSAPSSITTIGVGQLRDNTPSNPMDGRLSLLQIHDIALSADWIAYDYLQQNQATFWGAWSWTAVGPTVYALECNPGSFIIAGQNATLRKNSLLECNSGSVVITGQNASLYKNSHLSCSPGSFVINGQNATLRKNSVLICSPGLFSITGTDAGLFANRVLNCEPGAFVITGVDADLNFAGVYVLICEPGEFVITGQNASLIYFNPDAVLSGYEGLVIPKLKHGGAVERLEHGLSVLTLKHGVETQ